jgi:hypothetical protein
MTAFQFGSISALSVETFSGFDLPSDVSIVNILGDGTTDFNAVLQSPGTRLPSAQLSGKTTDPAIIATLRAYRASEEQVEMTEPDASHNVVVTDFSSQRSAKEVMLYNWSMTVVELPVLSS